MKTFPADLRNRQDFDPFLAIVAKVRPVVGRKGPSRGTTRWRCGKTILGGGGTRCRDQWAGDEHMEDPVLVLSFTAWRKPLMTKLRKLKILP